MSDLPDDASPSALPLEPTPLEPTPLEPTPVDADKRPRPPRRRKRGIIAAAIVAAGVLGLGGTAAILLSDPSTEGDTVSAEAKKREPAEKAARATWQAANALIVPSDRYLLRRLVEPVSGTRTARMMQMNRQFVMRANSSGRVTMTSGAGQPLPALTPPPPDAASVLARNAPALRAVRAALPLPYRAAPDDAASGSSTFHRMTDFFALGCLLLLDGNEKQKKGDLAGASSAYLDIIQTGQTLARGGPTPSLSGSGAYQSVGRTALWKLVEKMDGQTARQTAKRLEALCADWDAHVSYADALVEEKKRGDAAIRALFRDPTRLQMVRALAASASRGQSPMQMQMQRVQLMQAVQRANQARRAVRNGSNGGSPTFTAPPPLFPSPSPAPANAFAPWEPLVQRWNEWKMVRDFDATMNERIAASRLPYQTQQATFRKTQPTQQISVSVSSGGSSVSVSGGSSQGRGANWFPASTSVTYTSYGSPGNLQDALREWTDCQAENRLLLAALARQAYRADHAGHDPAHLSDLVPAYLSHMPDDPYTLPFAPLRFQKGVLYSVGTDGKDDNGTPVKSFPRAGGPVFGFYGMSMGHYYGKGDLVAQTPPQTAGP